MNGEYGRIGLMLERKWLELAKQYNRSDVTLNEIKNEEKMTEEAPCIYRALLVTCPSGESLQNYLVIGFNSKVQVFY